MTRPSRHSHDSPHLEVDVRPAPVFAAAALAACALTGCSDGRATSARATALATGAVAGVALAYGGPATADGRMAVSGAPAGNFRVDLLQGDRVVATTTTDPTGAFRLDVAPGTYRLACSTAPTVTVSAGRTTTVSDCTEQIP